MISIRTINGFSNELKKIASAKNPMESLIDEAVRRLKPQIEEGISSGAKSFFRRHALPMAGAAALTGTGLYLLGRYQGANKERAKIHANLISKLKPNILDKLDIQKQAWDTKASTVAQTRSFISKPVSNKKPTQTTTVGGTNIGGKNTSYPGQGQGYVPPVAAPPPVQ